MRVTFMDNFSVLFKLGLFWKLRIKWICVCDNFHQTWIVKHISFIHRSPSGEMPLAMAQTRLSFYGRDPLLFVSSELCWNLLQVWESLKLRRMNYIVHLDRTKLQIRN